MHATDALAHQAQIDETKAYNFLAALPSTANLTGQDLGGLTLTPGVYHYDKSAQLTGALTLNFAGASHQDFVFQLGSTLTSASMMSSNADGRFVHKDGTPYPNS